MTIEPSPTPSGVSIGTRKRATTYASLFIVESLGFDDEEDGRLEGDILSQILRLAGKETAYRYIRTKKELGAVLPQFHRSGLRYLHLSCHGNDNSLATTLDELPFDELGAMLAPYVADRRVFVSACEAVNDDLARSLMRRGGCYSIVGPATEVRFDDAAVIWAAFYHLMFKENPKAMKSTGIEAALGRLVETFGVPMTYIRRTSKRPYWRRTELS